MSRYVGTYVRARSGRRDPAAVAGVALLLLTVLALGVPRQAAASSIPNAGFEGGVLAPWEVFVSNNNGIVAPAGSTVEIVPFASFSDMLTLTLSAQLQVGQLVHFPSLPAEGGGIRQTLSLALGELVVSFDIAVEDANNRSNLVAGTFTLLFDDVPVTGPGTTGTILLAGGPVTSPDATVDFGPIEAGQVRFGQINAVIPVTTAGLHEIAILITRAGESKGNTPFEYIDNITLSVSEPSSAALLLTALLTVALSRRLGRSER